MWKFFKYFGLAVLLSIVCLGFYIASEFNNDIYKWNEKLTIEVETTEGLKTASAVQTVVFRHSHGKFILPHASGLFLNVVGEAPVIEVKPGRYLFALFKGRNGSYQFRQGNGLYLKALDELYKRAASKKAGRPLTIAENLVLTQNYKGQPFDVPKPFYPLLVTFTDINDPASVKEVHPLALEEFFGPDVKLKSLTLEITDEPVTRGRVEKVLGWLDKHIGRLDGNRYGTIKSNNRFANSLSAGAFKTERSR